MERDVRDFGAIGCRDGKKQNPSAAAATGLALGQCGFPATRPMQGMLSAQYPMDTRPFVCLDPLKNPGGGRESNQQTPVQTLPPACFGCF
jgi:hypothetical protein